MSPEDIRDAVVASPELQALIDGPGDYHAVAAALSDMQSDTTRSLRVVEMFDVLYTTGDYATIKAAQLAGDARAMLAFGALGDAQAIGPGTVNLQLSTTTQLLDSLQTAPVLLSAAGRAALLAASVTRPGPIDWRTVQAALKDN